MQEDKEKQPDNVIPIERDLTPEEQDELEESIKRHPASSGKTPKQDASPDTPPDQPGAE